MCQTKVCNKCGLCKPINEFYFRKDRNEYRLECKNCYDKNSKSWRKKNREKIKLGKRDNKEREIYYSAKCRAKKRNLEFSISIGDIIIPKKCPVLGIPIVLNSDGSTVSGSPTLDRIDNSKGYVKGNVCVISHRANSIKRDSTYKELLLIIEYVKKNSIDITI